MVKLKAIKVHNIEIVSPEWEVYIYTCEYAFYVIDTQ